MPTRSGAISRAARASPAGSRRSPEPSSSCCVATSTRYGFHRDELYFIVAGSHPALGYPDQPPLVPLVSWAMHGLAPGSPLTLRLPSALAAAATTVLAGLVAREAGGGRRAQVIAAACTAVSGFALAVGHFVTTTTFDLLEHDRARSGS